MFNNHQPLLHGWWFSYAYFGGNMKWYEAITHCNKRFGYAGAPVAGVTDKLQNNKICVSCY